MGKQQGAVKKEKERLISGLWLLVLITISSLWSGLQTEVRGWLSFYKRGYKWDLTHHFTRKVEETTWTKFFDCWKHDFRPSRSLMAIIWMVTAKNFMTANQKDRATLTSKNKKHYRKVLLISFHFNGSILGFHPQTQVFEPPCRAEGYCSIAFIWIRKPLFTTMQCTAH